MATSVLQRLKIVFEADTKNAKTGMGRLRTEMRKTRSATAALAGAAGFGLVTKEIFKMGAAVEETQSKFDIVFGQSSASVQSFIDDFSTMAGLTSQQSQEIISTTGAIAQGMGFAQEASAAFSTDVVALAGDLAAFNNLPTADVARAVQSALTGERESLKTLGIVINQAEVDERALTIARMEGRSEINNQDKALATLQLTTEKAGVAVGNLAETQFTAAGQARALSSEIAEIKNSISAALLPALSLGVRGFRMFLGGLELLGAEVALKIGELSLAWEKLQNIFGGNQANVDAATAGLAAMRAEVERLEIQTGQLAVALAGGGGGGGGGGGAGAGAGGGGGAGAGGGGGGGSAGTSLADAMTTGVGDASRFLTGQMTQLQAAALALSGELDGSLIPQQIKFVEETKIATVEVHALTGAMSAGTDAAGGLASALGKLGGLGGKLGKLGGLLGFIPGAGGLFGAASGLLGKLGGFAGFFADGGNIGAGKFGVVGESGPEVVQGPASVSPAGVGDVNITLVMDSGRKIVDTITVKQKRDSDLRRIVRVPVSAVATG